MNHEESHVLPIDRPLALILTGNRVEAAARERALRRECRTLLERWAEDAPGDPKAALAEWIEGSRW